MPLETPYRAGRAILIGARGFRCMARRLMGGERFSLYRAAPDGEETSGDAGRIGEANSPAHAARTGVCR